jgi:hypothetical protein
LLICKAKASARRKPWKKSRRFSNDELLYMPRYVILFHDCPTGHPRPSHWDFMLEWGAVLRTWAMPAQPCAGMTLIAEALGDHRLDYLQFEGPLSDGRGQVSRWDSGDYHLESETQQELVVRLVGKRCCGLVTLRSLLNDPLHWNVEFAVA